jgi:uncharacterized membrane protein YeaQ/YmgE (transglycosylase-associated protein family)
MGVLRWYAPFFGGGNIVMLHLLWYIIVGLIAGFVAKSALHMHMTLLWTIVLGLVGSILGGFITHLFDRPKPEANYHPAGIIVSILCALLVLWLLSKIPIFPLDQLWSTGILTADYADFGIRVPGSARASRAGDRALAIANFS